MIYARVKKSQVSGFKFIISVFLIIYNIIIRFISLMYSPKIISFHLELRKGCWSIWSRAPKIEWWRIIFFLPFSFCNLWHFLSRKSENLVFRGVYFYMPVQPLLKDYWETQLVLKKSRFLDFIVSTCSLYYIKLLIYYLYYYISDIIILM